MNECLYFEMLCNQNIVFFLHFDYIWLQEFAKQLKVFLSFDLN